MSKTNAEEQEAKRLEEEQEAKRLEEEQEAKRLEEEQEAKRLEAEQEAKRLEEQEAKRLADEEEAKRLAAEEEAKRNTLIDDFVNAKLSDTRIVRRPELNIAGKKMKFDVGTNNILYDVDITQEEFNEKVKFLHPVDPVDSQDASGIKFQYRVVKKVDGKYITMFKSDSYVESGKVKRTNIKQEV